MTITSHELSSSSYLGILLQLCESKKYHKETNAQKNFMHTKGVIQKV
jgi:hypothetical protein